MDLKVQAYQYKPAFQAQVKQTRSFRKLGPASEKIFNSIAQGLSNIGDDSIKVTLRGKGDMVYVDMCKKHGLFNADCREWNYSYYKLGAIDNTDAVQSLLWILKSIIDDM